MFVKVAAIKDFIGNSVEELGTKVVLVNTEDVSYIDTEYTFSISLNSNQYPTTTTYIGLDPVGRVISPGNSCVFATGIYMKNGNVIITKDNLDTLAGILAAPTNRMRGATI